MSPERQIRSETKRRQNRLFKNDSFISLIFSGKYSPNMEYEIFLIQSPQWIFLFASLFTKIFHFVVLSRVGLKNIVIFESSHFRKLAIETKIEKIYYHEKDY